MTDISIQFHALPEEVIAFAKQVMDDFNLHAVAMRFFPYEAVEVTSEEIGKVAEAIPPFRGLAFTLNEPLLPAKNSMDFLAKNPNSLGISLAREGPEGLRQIALSARTDNPAALSIWRKVAKRLKGITTAGVVVMNPDSGVTAPERTFRFTSGAKALASTGVPMLPIGGGNVVKFPDK